MFGFNSKRRLPVTLALLVGLVVISLAIGRADGAKPHPGATYAGTIVVSETSGRIIQKLDIDFTVNRTGSKVEAITFDDGLPNACSAARVGPVVVRARSLSIISPSRFRGDFPILRRSPTSSSQRVGTLEIVGSFGSLNRAPGAVGAAYDGALAGCDASGAFTSHTQF